MATFVSRSYSIVYIVSVTVVLSQVTTSAVFAGPVLESNQLEVIFLSTSSQNSTISCWTPEDPDLLIAWHNNTIPLSISSEVVDGLQVNGLGDLIFSPIKVEHTGWYTCAASNAQGRTELDFLVIVQTAPDIIRIHRPDDLDYIVLPGSRVELPCLGNGVPPPDVKWFNTNGNVIVDGAEDGRYRIDPGTGSLIITDFTSADAAESPFHCELSNPAGMKAPGRRNRGSLDISSKNIAISSPINDFNSTSLYLTPDMETQVLECTTDIDLAALNYTVTWTKNFVVISDQNNSIEVNPAIQNDEGFYCCQVVGIQVIIATYCATVAIRANPILNTSPPNLITLPSRQNRTANLVCRGSTPNIVDPPVIDWKYSNSTPVVTNADLNIQVSNFSDHYGYVQLQDVGEPMEESIVCNAGNFWGSKTAEVMVKTVDVCQDENVLLGSNAEDLFANLEQYWTPFLNDNVNNSASFSTVNNERVFKLVYKDDGVTLYQNRPFPVMNADYFVELSGRIRQEGSGVASIQFMVDGTTINFLEHPSPTSVAWHWVYKRFKSVRGSVVTLALTVNFDGPGAISGVAYFDDLCMTFTRVTSGPDGGLTTTHYIIIGAAGGAVVILLLLILITICCCCCCCRKRKQKVPMMRKMSRNIKKKFTLTRYNKSKEIALELSARLSPDSVGKGESKEFKLSVSTSEPLQTQPPQASSPDQEEDNYYVEVHAPPKANNGGIAPQSELGVETEPLRRSPRVSVTSPHEDYQAIDIQTKNDDTYYATCTPRSQSLEDLINEGQVPNPNPRPPAPRTSVTSPMGLVSAVEEEETYYVTPHSHSCSASSLLKVGMEDSGEYQNVEPPVKYLELVADNSTPNSLSGSPKARLSSTSLEIAPQVRKQTRSISTPMLPPGFINPGRHLSTGSIGTKKKKDRSISVTAPVSPYNQEQIYANDQDMNIYENSVEEVVEENIYDN